MALDGATPNSGTDVLNLLDTFTKQVTANFDVKFDGLNSSMKQSDKRMERRLDKIDDTLVGVRDKVLLHDERLAHGARSFEDLRGDMGGLASKVDELSARPSFSKFDCTDHRKQTDTNTKEVAEIKAMDRGEKLTKSSTKETVTTVFAGVGLLLSAALLIVGILKLVAPYVAN